MATDYNGKPSLVTHPTSLNISSSTNATPIEVTTTAAHGLTDGDIVRVKTHSTNTAANGFWQVVVTSSTKFTLKDPASGANSVGNGVGGATGTVDRFSTGTFSIPADLVDDMDAASINVGLEANGDRTAYALWKLGVGSVANLVRAQRKSAYVNRDIFDAWSQDPVAGQGGAGGGWTELTAATSGSSPSTFIAGAGDLDIVPGDEVELEFATTAAAIHATGQIPIGFSLFAHLYDYGTSPAFASAVRVPGIGVAIPTDTALVIRYPVVLRTVIPVSDIASVTRGKAMRVYLAANCAFGAGNAAVSLYGDRRVNLRVWR